MNLSIELPKNLSSKCLSETSHYSFFTVLLLAFACFEFIGAPNAVGVNPPPNGGYARGCTAEGTNSLFSLTTGVWNTGLGFQALYNNTAGDQNTATGYQTLFSNASGGQNTATGGQALFSNTTGSFNVGTGFRALYSNTTGNSNTGTGFECDRAK